MCLGTLLGNTATHRGHCLLVHSVLHTIIRYLFSIILPPPKGERNTQNAKVMFSSIFVGLSVSHVTGKLVNGFSWKLQDRSDLVRGTTWSIWGMFDSTPCIHDFFFYLFTGESVSVSNITEKRENRSSWNFQYRSNMRQGTIWIDFSIFWVRNF